MNENLITLIQTVVKTECPPFYQKYSKFFEDEILSEFVNNIFLYPKIIDGNEVPIFFKPIFKLEVKYEIRKLILPFFNTFSLLNNEKNNENQDNNLYNLKKLFCEAKIEDLLLILGQRITPGSIRNEIAIPPKRIDLLASAKVSNKAGLFDVARALSKHSSRNNEKFWGKIHGTVDEQNKNAIFKLEEILNGKTWWNVFGHGKHDYVYEIRTSLGYGARWRYKDLKFIGFIEPLDPESGIMFDVD